ncbi:NADPH-dependent F420 reductase [Jatrophihabitans endophyticus]|uniref:NADPH-dependent F420 reductase n=1 Tax=Jatrophihabitans endophyticus TaxID=1206085 RepID=UPI001A0BE707|nr:NAD(P)-binding domain-containing protein [Jatrophihabitans endophyticus]MBE7190645.1 NAD(P)-binding domain-containing protein [Jatrophihabitans endophyticus]
MRIAVLGTGTMGVTFAKGLQRVGHDVVLGSRDPGRHRDLPLPVRTSAEAIVGGDLVVNALDGRSSLDALTAMRGELDGHILLDVGNAVDENFDPIYPDSSLGERLQFALPGTRVVKSLSTLWGGVAVEPAMLSAPTTVFLSGDDPAAKAVVAGVLGDLGWTPDTQLDLGGIATSRAVEYYFVLFTRIRLNGDDPAFNIAVVR